MTIIGSIFAIFSAFLSILGNEKYNPLIYSVLHKYSFILYFKKEE